MENLPGVDRMMMNGTRATLVLAGGAKLTDAQVTKALKAQGLKFETLNQHKIDRAGAAFIAKTPKFT